MAGEENVGFSNGTFLSERDNADRNYALAYYMRENNCYPEKCELMASLDLYFQVSIISYNNIESLGLPSTFLIFKKYELV